MNNDKLSAIISLVVATVILAASFFQWWDITFNGAMKTKRWVKILLALLILSLLLALSLLLIGGKK